MLHNRAADFFRELANEHFYFEFLSFMRRSHFIFCFLLLEFHCITAFPDVTKQWVQLL